MKKMLRLIMVLFIMGSQIPFNIVFAETKPLISYENKFITNVKIVDKNGNETSNIPINSSFKVRYDWSIPNDIDVYEGDQMEIILPAELQTVQNTALEFKDSAGNIIAHGQATSQGGNNYVVTFTDYVETHSDINGFFEFYVEFSSQVQPGEKNDIAFDIPGGTVTIPVTPEEEEGPGPGPDPESKPQEDKFYKSGYFEMDGPGTISWYVNIIPPKFQENPILPNLYEPLNNVTLFDELGKGQELIKDTVQVRQAYGWPSGVITMGEWEDFPVTNYDSTKGTFEVNLGNIDDGLGRQVKYVTQISDPYQEVFDNKASVTGEDYERETSQTIKSEGGSAGGSGFSSGFSVVKQDSEGNPLQDAVFDLYRYNNTGERMLIAKDLVSNSEGEVSYTGLKLGKYELIETKAPLGFVLLETPYEFNIIKSGVNQLQIPIVNEKEITEINGTKTWEDKGNQDGKRPETITVNLLANGELKESKEVTATDNWAYNFTNLPKYEEGKEIFYTVTENAVPGYTTEINGNNLINRYTPSKTNVTVTKAWNDKNNQDGLRPESIKVQLYGEGKAIGEEVELSSANKWTHTWTELDEKENGKAIEYTVKEISNVTGYTTVIEDKDKGNTIITNSHTPEITEINGTKTWEDKGNQDGKRPETITVNLLANGELKESKEVTAADNWAYNFTNLPKYEEGKEIFYTVTENAVPGYTTEINGNNLINRYTPSKTSVTVTKAWNDKNDQDGLRPESIKVQLYGEGKAIGEEVELSSANKWTHTWTELDEKENGKAIEYTVKEISNVTGYTTVIEDKDKGNTIITNSHTPEITEINGTKTWEDKGNQDGKRPETITVNLLANGELKESKEVTAADNWAYNFTNLPKYEEGKEIFYTVTENAVPGYTTEINGNNLINRYTPSKTSVTVTKAWNDKNDQDGLRPESIKVQLYGEGKAIGEEVELSSANKWTHTWTELDEKENGKAIEYTVKEISNVTGYTTVIEDKDKGNIIITNSHTPETKSMTNNNHQGNKLKKISNEKRLLPKTGEKITLSLATIGGISIMIVLIFTLYRKMNLR